MSHKVTVASVGGCCVLTCESLQIANIEYYPDELTHDGVQKVIREYKFLPKDEKLDLEIEDTRPPAADYHKQKREQSQSFKKSDNNLKAPHF